MGINEIFNYAKNTLLGKTPIIKRAKESEVVQEEAWSTTIPSTVCYYNTELLFCVLCLGAAAVEWETWIAVGCVADVNDKPFNQLAVLLLPPAGSIYTGWSFALCLSACSPSAKHTSRRQMMSPTFEGPLRSARTQFRWSHWLSSDAVQAFDAGKTIHCNQRKPICIRYTVLVQVAILTVSMRCLRLYMQMSSLWSLISIFLIDLERGFLFAAQGEKRKSLMLTSEVCCPCALFK